MELMGKRSSVPRRHPHLASSGVGQPTTPRHRVGGDKCQMFSIARSLRILQNMQSCGLLAPFWHESPSPPAASPWRRRRLRRRRRRGFRQVCCPTSLFIACFNNDIRRYHPPRGFANTRTRPARLKRGPRADQLAGPWLALWQPPQLPREHCQDRRRSTTSVLVQGPKAAWMWVRGLLRRRKLGLAWWPRKRWTAPPEEESVWLAPPRLTSWRCWP